MKWFFQKDNSPMKTVLTVLVTSYSVKAMVVRKYLTPGSVEIPLVIFSAEELIRLHPEGGDIDRVAEVYELVKRVITTCQKHVKKYDAMTVVLGDPWVNTYSRQAHLKRKESFVVTQKIINDLASRETKLFEQEIVRMNQSGKDFGMIESTSKKVLINGYPVHEAPGHEASTVDVVMNLSVAPASIVHSINLAFQDVFHRTDVLFYAIDQTFDFLMNKQEQGTVVVFGGFTTSFHSYENGSAKHHARISSGMHTIESSLIRLFGVHRFQLSNIFSLVTDQNIIELERDRFYKRLYEAYSNLGSAINLAQVQIGKHVGMLPSPWIVLGQESIKVFKEYFTDEVDQEIIMPAKNLLDAYIVWSQEAVHQSVEGSLAALYVLDRVIAKK